MATVLPHKNPAQDLKRPPKEKKSLLLRRKGKSVKRLRSGIDWPFAILLIILLCIGTTFVFSSSYIYAKHNYNDSYFFIRKQIGWAIASVGILYICSSRMVDYLILKKFALPIFLISYVLLCCVFFFGADANGAKRWIYFGGLSVQPSEIMKFTVILIISRYLVWLDERGTDLIRTAKYGIYPFLILVVAVGLPLYKQPHLSAMIIIFGLIFILMFLGGVRGDVLGFAIVAGALAMTVLILFTDHGQSRINAWLHPELDPLGDGWQPLQSLYAIGSGGLWGVGLGRSMQKHLYLPEPQNDYIFAVICEEMGFVFAVAIILLFLLLIWRGFRIAQNAPSKFSSLLVMGIMLQVGIQVFLNIGVVSGALPSTGVSLPFFSYGGSSLVILMAEMGIVLNVSRYSYTEKA